MPNDFDPAVRVFTLGDPRGPVASSTVFLARAPRREAASSMLAWARAARSVRHGRYDAVHLTDVRLAPVGRWLRRRTGVAVSVDAGPQDLAALPSRPRLAAAIDALDAAFVFGGEGERALRVVTRRAPVTALPLVALPPEEPAAKVTRAVACALAGADSLRPLVALPWTDDAGAWRECEELVRALADAGAIPLVAGAPDRRRAAWLRAELDVPSLRVYAGALDDAALAAIARCADVFVVPWRMAPDAPSSDALVRLAMAASGVPVVATDHPANVLVHERDAFLVRDGDVRGFRATVARLLELPARQRHYMGAEFARWTLGRWPVDAAIDAYNAGIASLAGRFEVPLELRAAA